MNTIYYMLYIVVSMPKTEGSSRPRAKGLAARHRALHVVKLYSMNLLELKLSRDWGFRV